MRNEYVFLDCEFTGLEQRFPHLISIGLVAMDGCEFYAELPEKYYVDKCTDWGVDNVLPLLDGGQCVMQPDQLKINLQKWLVDMSNPVQLATDAPQFDFYFFTSLFETDWPDNVDKKSAWLRGDDLESDYQDFFIIHDKPQHHALNDARALRQAYIAQSAKN